MFEYDKFSTGFLITKAARIVTSMYQKELSRFDITPPQASILWILSKAKEVSQTEIVRALMLDKANVSALVRKLRDEDFLKVRQADNDGRKSMLSLSNKGREVVKKIDVIDKKISKLLEETGKTGDMNQTRNYLNDILRVVQ
jgi:DNA-binding MarR family transcriptional regulator